MWLLSDDPHRSIVRLSIYAIAIALSFEWFFVRLLKVQMPGAGRVLRNAQGTRDTSIPGPREVACPE